MAKDTAPHTSHSSEKLQSAIGTDSTSVRTELSAERRTPFLLRVLPEIALFAVSTFFFVSAFGFETVDRGTALGPGFWPKVVSVSIAICAVITFVQKAVDYRRPALEAEAAAGETVMADAEDESVIYWPRVALAIALVVGYPLATIFIGYPLATALLLIVFLYLGGQRKWYIVPIGVLGSLVFAYVFAGVVYVSLPYGVGVFGSFTNALYQLLGI